MAFYYGRYTLYEYVLLYEGQAKLFVVNNTAHVYDAQRVGEIKYLKNSTAST